MSEAHTTTESQQPIPRNSLPSSLLLFMAWGFYGSSLYSPAIEMNNWSTAEPSGTYSTGWEIVFTLLIPFLWPFGVTFLFLLVNVCFWSSPFMLPKRRFRGMAWMGYPVLLIFATNLGWMSYFYAASVSSGFFYWGLELVTACVAFCLPLKESSTVDGESLHHTPDVEDTVIMTISADDNTRTIEPL